MTVPTDYLDVAQRAFDKGMEAWKTLQPGSREEATLCFQAATAATGIGRELAAREADKKLAGMQDMAQRMMQQGFKQMGVAPPAHALPFDPADHDPTQEPEE